MSKKKKINFIYPLNGRLLPTMSALEVEVTATNVIKSRPDEVEFDFDSIKWNGVDVLPLLDNIKGSDDVMQHISEAALVEILNQWDE